MRDVIEGVVYKSNAKDVGQKWYDLQLQPIWILCVMLSGLKDILLYDLIILYNLTVVIN